MTITFHVESQNNLFFLGEKYIQVLSVGFIYPVNNYRNKLYISDFSIGIGKLQREGMVFFSKFFKINQKLLS